jgi:hypothetical protein
LQLDNKNIFFMLVLYYLSNIKYVSVSYIAKKVILYDVRYVDANIYIYDKVKTKMKNIKYDLITLK